jgi:hypothetical protein
MGGKILASNLYLNDYFIQNAIRAAKSVFHSPSARNSPMLAAAHAEMNSPVPTLLVLPAPTLIKHVSCNVPASTSEFADNPEDEWAADFSSLSAVVSPNSAPSVLTETQVQPLPIGAFTADDSDFSDSECIFETNVPTTSANEPALTVANLPQVQEYVAVP